MQLKTISYFHMNIVFIKNFVVVYLFDFLKLSIILTITLIGIVMWSFKHYSQLILILSLLILPPPINFFFVPQNNKREKNISCIELLCVLILKNRQPYHKEQLPFYIS